MNYHTYKLKLKLVRNFSVGFTIFSPKYNGFCFELKFACLSLMVSSKGSRWLGFRNYWENY